MKVFDIETTPKRLVRFIIVCVPWLFLNLTGVFCEWYTDNVWVVLDRFNEFIRGD